MAPTVIDITFVSEAVRHRRALMAWVVSMPIPSALKERLKGIPLPVLYWARYVVDRMISMPTFRLIQPGVLDEFPPNTIAELSARGRLKLVLCAQAEMQPHFVDGDTRRLLGALVARWNRAHDHVLLQMKQDRDSRVRAASELLCAGAMDMAALVLFELLDSPRATTSTSRRSS